MLANFSEVEFLKTVSKFRKRERKSSASFTSSTKRKIRHFHVVIVQRQQRNAKKRVMYVQSCCFVDLNILSFCRSRCRRRCRCLSPVLLVGITASVRLSRYRNPENLCWWNPKSWALEYGIQLRNP